MLARTMSYFTCALALLITLLCCAQDRVQPVEGLAATDDEQFSVLLFTKTAGFRHDSIHAGITAMQDLGKKNGFVVVSAEDATAFTQEGLSPFKVVVFLNTTGDVLDDDQQDALMLFIRAGGGFVGIHAATDCEYDWEWYGRLIGARFASHPQVQRATIRVVDRNHLSTRDLPDSWQRTDEWYNFRELGKDLHVLALLDESTYEGGAMGESHPFAWCHEFDGGRAWYTAGGHTAETFSEEHFRKHLLGGIQWAAGGDKRRNAKN